MLITKSENVYVFLNTAVTEMSVVGKTGESVGVKCLLFKYGGRLSTLHKPKEANVGFK